MKKSFAVAFFVTVLCGLLVVPLLLKPPSVASQGEQQTAPKITFPPDIKIAPEENPQSIPKNTPQPELIPSISPQSTNQTSNDKLEVTINNAINFMAQTQEPYALLMLNVLYRRFGITEFKDTLQRYDEILSSCNQPLLKIYRRMADHNNTVDETDFNTVVDIMDIITVPALYSDQRSPPENYPSVLINAKNSGGYMMTHVLLATIWLQENNCNISIPEYFMETLYHDTAALTERSIPVTDVAIEAAAFLCQAGQGNLVHPDFAENVIAAQNPDGGWSISSSTPNDSDWHPSVLALMFLLHVKYLASSYPPMLAPALG